MTGCMICGSPRFRHELVVSLVLCDLSRSGVRLEACEVGLDDLAKATRGGNLHLLLNYGSFEIWIMLILKIWMGLFPNILKNMFSEYVAKIPLALPHLEERVCFQVF